MNDFLGFLYGALAWAFGDVIGVVPVPSTRQVHRTEREVITRALPRGRGRARIDRRGRAPPGGP